jgi:succinate dehydrogenase flavin-adding protein (antitoxin of CptAB toxin-antitoxin module)
MTQHVQWMCRRSLLELDALFSFFYQHHYQLLSQADQVSFAELLKLEDGEIIKMIHQKDDMTYPILSKVTAAYQLREV